MEIKSVVAREENGNIQITFSVPYALIKKAQDEAISEMSRDIEIPGFRKGKAPLSKVRQKISESSLIEHSLSHILPKALGKAMEEHKLRLAVYPKFELISAKKDEDWQIRGVSCELPAVDLGDYRSIVAGEIRAVSLKKEPSKQEKEQAAIKALLTSIKIKIPNILIEEEAQSRLSNLLSRLEKLGLALESYLASTGKKPEDLRAEYANQAREAISLDLILTKVAETENFKADEKEINEALKVSQAPETEERKRLIESLLKRRMALELLSNLK